MFGHRYFGARYFGPRYFGPAAGAVVEEDEETVGYGRRRRRKANIAFTPNRVDDEDVLEIARIFLGRLP